MIANVKARFSNGALTPLEPLDLEEGEEVTVSIKPQTQLSDEDRPKTRMSASGGGKGSDNPNTHSINDMFDNIRKSLSHIPKEHGPTDGAKNYKHYLYGHPKEE